MVVLHRDANPLYVVTSFILAFLGSYVAVNLAEHNRLSHFVEVKLLSPRVIYFLMSTSLGIAIFCMHFVGMGSIILSTDDGSKIIPIEFDIGLTIVSLFAAIAFGHVGLIISSRDRAYIRTKTQIAQMTVEDASSMTIKQIQSTNMIKLVLFRNLKPLLLGGFVTGSGIVVMHYVGMKAVIFPGVVRYYIGIMAASIIIAIITACTAFWILFRFLAVYPSVEGYRLVSAVLMAIAVCGMHYTGAAGAEFDYDPTMQGDSYSALISSSTALSVTFWVGLFYPFLVIFLTFADIRQWTYTRNQTMERIDNLIKSYQVMASISHDKSFDIDSFVAKYQAINITKPALLPESNSHSIEFEWTLIRFLHVFRGQVYPSSRKGSTDEKTVPLETNEAVC